VLRSGAGTVTFGALTLTPYTGDASSARAISSSTAPRSKPGAAPIPTPATAMPPPIIPQLVDDLEVDLEIVDGQADASKLRKAIHDFGAYIRINHKCIPNYGERYRSGETISTAFVESAVNQVMSKRMAKKQQMRWTRCGAHHMLQVCTQVLDGELRRTFCRWYPGMAPEAANEMAVAA